MKQDRRMGIYEQFCGKSSVLFSNDVASRGLDFNKSVDWVVQVDCPEDVASYIHRVGRTARYLFGGIFRWGIRYIPYTLRNEDARQITREEDTHTAFVKANTERLQPVS